MKSTAARRQRRGTRWLLPLLLLAGIAPLRAEPVRENGRALLAALNSAPVRRELPRRIAIASLVEHDPGLLDSLETNVLKQAAARQDGLSAEELEWVANGAAAVTMGRQLAALPDCTPELAAWLLQSNAQLLQLVDNFGDKTHLPQRLAVLRKLAEHDAAGRTKYFNLMLAMALVWDKTPPPLHQQMGGQPPASDPQLDERYDYFRDLYEKRRAKIPYEKLNVRALTLAVYTPLPVDELRWALQNAQPSLADWSRLYFAVRYDQKRLDAGAYQWPETNGLYTLQAILKRGGICVDQAYYAVMTARAWGVPAVFFHAEGRRGGHAWMAYMKNEREWAFNVGRYQNDNYATGFTADPVTGAALTDHDMEYISDGSLRHIEDAQFFRQTLLADFLLDHDATAAARRLAQAARHAAPKYEKPWDIEVESWRKENRLPEAAAALDQKAQALSRYPDRALHAHLARADILRQMGKKAEANELVRHQAYTLGRYRDDIFRDLLQQQAREAVGEGRHEEGRKILETLLLQQQNEGVKMADILNTYVDITHSGPQAHQAANYLDVYINNLFNRNLDIGTDEKISLLNILLRACEGVDATRGEHTKKRIAQLSAPPPSAKH